MTATGKLTAALADRYQIQRQLGQGGMATVYLAEDLKHKRNVALKVLRPELAAVLGGDRFVQEITTTAQLQHPHILPLFDSGEADGFLYYVMPYIEGETLRDKLNREGQVGIEEAVKITVEVADALQYAHTQGVIHRDIKPENILIQNGRPMVADFGIALALSAAAGGRMTETGMSLGTPHYMSPEQATADREITARSDVYSLASVLYEMLAGQPPHLGGTAQQIIMKIIAEPVAAVTTLRKSVPPNVTAALAKALEKLPADRFDTAEAFSDALTNPGFTVATGAAVGGASTRPRVHVSTSVVAGVAALATIAAVWGWLRPPPEQPVIRYSMWMPEGQQPVIASTPPTPAPDGSYLMYIGPGADEEQTRLWLKPRESHSAVPISGTDGATAFAIAPDGQSVVFGVGDDLRTISLAGGAPVTLVNGGVVSGLGVAWLEGGRIAYVSGEGGIHLAVMPQEGGGTVTIRRLDSLGLPALPAGIAGTSGLLFTICNNQVDCSLWVHDLETGTQRVLVSGATGGQFVPPGFLVFGMAGGLSAVQFDRGRLETVGAPVSLADSILIASVSQSGTLVAIRGALGAARFQMDWVDRTGRRSPVDTGWTFQLTVFAANAGWALSPDGSRLAIGLNGMEGDDIWIKPLPHGPAARVTFDPGPEYRPRWTGDGRSVTFIRAGAGGGVRVARADGTGADSQLFAGGVIQEAVVSPDGLWLLMRQGGSVGAGGRDLVGRRLDGDTSTVPVVVTRYDEEAAMLSPDGRWLAYQSDETGRTEVFVRPFPETDGGKWQVSDGGGEAPLWSRDGRELFYLGGGRDMMAVRIAGGTALGLGQPTVLFRVAEEYLQVETAFYTPWDVAPDGRFLMARVVDPGTALRPTAIVVENFVRELAERMRQ